MIITTDTEEMDMATRADLEKENAELRAKLARYEGRPAAAGAVSFGMSEGVRNDIEQAKADLADPHRDPRAPKEVVVHDGGTGATYRVYLDGDTVAVEEYPDGDLTAMAPTAPGRTDDLPDE